MANNANNDGGGLVIEMNLNRAERDLVLLYTLQGETCVSLKAMARELEVPIPKLKHELVERVAAALGIPGVCELAVTIRKL